MQQSLQLSLSDLVYTWFMALIQSSSTDWLSHFRQRAYLPVAQSSSPSTSPALIGYWTPWTASGTIPDYSYTDTNEFDTLGTSNKDATNGARQNEKALLDEPRFTWHANSVTSTLSSSKPFIPSKAPTFGEELFAHGPVSSGTVANSGPEASKGAFPLNQVDTGLQSQFNGLQMGAYRLHDPNFYKWLGRELGRWVTSIMSPNNPNCHVPSDKEIQHHARFLMYDE